ncbi:NADH-quinone oxidoreductase subunit N [Stratiformator vulcanicus]|uniref:NADH-quinone oxidoreductase subunit N n=1 Tax=Stratiformator vulcanicus TaxID=2527980 RepID=A0A517QZW1_9PLAN|nr:NADH-quinone oxidoreductase subunit N [Stratiformator vulcanicus]QDT37182.1 NADH-quinone oxidoreductase subunit N [Stratiformator vulcanicus]
MNLREVLDILAIDTLGVSLPLFAPELTLCGLTVALLLARLFQIDRAISPQWIALLGAGTALAIACLPVANVIADGSGTLRPTELFSGLLRWDEATIVFRVLILAAFFLTVWLSMLTGLPDRDDGPDYYTMLTGTTLGAVLMTEANHLLMMFLAVEMASVPGYALVGFQKGRRKSSEAALKYLIYGAGAAGVLLYGISLIAGASGTMSLTELAPRLSLIATETDGLLGSSLGRAASIGVLLAVAGIGFKLALVPFQFWCPDAFEGASAETAGFLSVVPKIGAFALLLRLLWPLTQMDAASGSSLAVNLGLGLAVISMLTMTVGNLAAYPQTNLKRLFAYSTIAHAGYMLMGPAAALVASQAADTAPEHLAVAGGLQGLTYYAAAYVFMNLGPFAVIAFIRNHTFREDIEGCRGMKSHLPIACVAMACCLYGLIGLPPSGGFMGKIMVFYAGLAAGNLSPIMTVMVVVASANTVASLFYYLRIIQSMFLQSPSNSADVEEIRPKLSEDIFLLVLAIPVIVSGIIVSPLVNVAASVARAITS